MLEERFPRRARFLRATGLGQDGGTPRHPWLWSRRIPLCSVNPTKRSFKVLRFDFQIQGAENERWNLA